MAWIRWCETLKGLLASGVDLRTVQDLMRHNTTAMIMRYAHSTSERRRAAVGKVLA